MKTKYRHVYFHKVSDRHWACHSNDIDRTVATVEQPIEGQIWFYSQVGNFLSREEVLRQIQYMRDIADFLGQLNQEAKA